MTKIVYNSFHGRYSDNPRAIFERLVDRPGFEHVWLAHAEQAAGFPGSVTTVDIDAPQARLALESADLVIANTHTEVDWDKPWTTTYVQTWHGTPLKRIHRDVLFAPPGRLDRLDRDIEKWDLLLSPNAASSPRLCKAFGFDGEVLESGYPRNDLLSSPNAADVRARVRAELGIPDGVTAVLYAPTWRDTEIFTEEAADVPLALDTADFAAALGDTHVLLVRTHTMTAGRSRVADTEHVRDVSSYPDVRDLYVAADVLVTDYSSAMFDFAITGRPMVFYAYDLDQFRDSIRGFYFDLESVAPGPIVETSGQLLDAVRRLGSSADEYTGPYAEFRRAFTGLEDGHATDRVLERLGLWPREAGGSA